MKRNTMGVAIFAVTAMVLVSCKKDKKDEGETTVTPTGYALGLRTLSGGTSADYVVTTADLMSGEIHANGVGIEQKAWTYYYQKGKRILALSYGDSPICTAYEIESATIKEKGSFAFERVDAFADVAGTDNIVGIGAPWGGGSYDVQIQTINTASMSITQNVATPLYTMYNDTNVRLNMWPTSTFLQNNKLYVAFYPLHGATWTTDRVDTAYVSVYNYPSMTYVKTFKDARTSPIGYYMAEGLVADENGNHYTFSTSSYAAGFSKKTKPSGILRINNGQDEFDPTYFFNIEEKGYKLMNGTYVGNNLVVARVIPNELDVTTWAAFNAATPIHKIAVIDLVAKTLKIVNEVPLHGGQYVTPYLKEDGKVYMSINSGSETYVYEINPATATAKKGAKVLGDQIQHFVKY